MVQRNPMRIPTKHMMTGCSWTRSALQWASNYILYTMIARTVCRRPHTQRICTRHCRRAASC